MTLNPPYPKDREPSWFERSSWAERDWKNAQAAYWEARARLGYPWRPDPGAHTLDPARSQAVADARIHAARNDYRTRVLSWYRVLCLPLGLGMVVPGRVAELQIEQWDLDGAPIGDAVNL